MAWDTEGAANVIVSILQNVRGPGGEKFGGVQIGVPASIGPQVYASVTAAGQQPNFSFGGTLRRPMHYNVTLSYRLDDAEGTAERVLMRLLDAFEIALFNNRKLNGTVEDLEVDAALASAAEYKLWAGKEFREFPVLITVYQSQDVAAQA